MKLYSLKWSHYDRSGLRAAHVQKGTETQDPLSSWSLYIIQMLPVWVPVHGTCGYEGINRLITCHDIHQCVWPYQHRHPITDIYTRGLPVKRPVPLNTRILTYGGTLYTHQHGGWNVTDDNKTLDRHFGERVYHVSLVTQSDKQGWQVLVSPVAHWCVLATILSSWVIADACFMVIFFLLKFNSLLISLCFTTCKRPVISTTWGRKHKCTDVHS